MDKSLPNRELVVYALSLLGGESQRIHTEDVAIKCHELFPDSFSWVKYPNLPDKDIVRVALTDARKQKYGALVDGRAGQSKGHYAQTSRGPSSDGWILTPEGTSWLNANKIRIENLVGKSHGKTHRQRLLKKLKKVKDHKLYRDFVENENEFNASIGDLADLLSCRVDADPHVWRKRFDVLMNVAVSAEQDDVQRFLARCEHSYEDNR